MAGVEVSEEITLDQLEAMGGGELLRQEVTTRTICTYVTTTFAIAERMAT